MPDMSPATALLFLREEELRQGFELLYFAFRDLGAEADLLLAERGLARAHHRVIHFIGQHPQIIVSDLLDILGITKQSLGRLLQQLVAQGLVVQRPGLHDRRQRLLSLTEAGQTLERQLWERQRRRIARAYRDSGPQAIEGFRKVLAGLVDADKNHRRFERPSSTPGAR
jgi:DNA-binding MarR family transcriptional regulator